MLSPWLHQLNRKRPTQKLVTNTHTDVVIVGGGIAGVMTAYFALKSTHKNILLVEAGKIAHGATGHNAGQLVSYFEKPFSEMASEFGVEMAARGQAEVESAWVLLEELFHETKLQTPLSQFTGYAGCKDLEEVLAHLEDNYWRAEGGLAPEKLFIAKEAPYLSHIGERYDGLYSAIAHKNILSLLETNDTSYTATLAARKGCMNSALFCEELVSYLLGAYPKRFKLAEHTPVERLVLNEHHANLHTAGDVVIYADQVVLCTNGFETITIENTLGADIDTKFHHLVRGSVGYMAGYLAPLDKPATAISYLPTHNTSDNAFSAEPYFYLTRRPYEVDGEKHNLICIGGPEALMDDTNNYHKEHPYPEEAQKAIDTFLKKTYLDAPQNTSFTFLWHGLMGYTPNGIRCVGFEPCNPVLLYNLGCNGVGILPSICGGKRIADLIAGEKLAPSIFDPQDKRCVVPAKTLVST